MKKIIYGSLFLTLIGIVGCKKDQIMQNNLTQSKDSTSMITQITDNYISAQSEIPAEKISPFWRRVIGADLTGAGAGVIAGGVAGAVTGGIGSVPGAIIGGILGVAGASFTAAGQENIANPGGNTGEPNPNNPYDFIGDIHYDIVDEMVNNYDLYMVNGELNYSKYEKLVFDHLKLKYENCDDKKHCFQCNFFASEIQFHANRDGNIVSYFVESNPRLNGMSSVVRNIIKEYSQAIQSTNKKGDFTEYSIACEDIIVNSQLNEQEKLQVLSYMATARYGINYYN